VKSCCGRAVTLEIPAQKLALSQQLVVAYGGVQKGVELDLVEGDLLLEEAVEEDGHGRQEHIVQGEHNGLVERRHRGGVEEGVVELTDDEAEILVEEVLDEAGAARIVDVAVREQDALGELELGEGEVGGEGGVAALLAKDAQAHVRLLDHRHVVGAVADRARHRL